MPSTPSSTMMAATINHRGPKVYDQIQQASPWLAWLHDKATAPWEGGGESFESLIRTGMNDTFAARSYKEQQQFAEQDPLEMVTIPSRYINGNIMWYNAQAESNEKAGKWAMVNFVNTLIDDARDAAKSRMALESWEYGAGEHLHGIGAIIGHENTYQGKDRTVAGNEYWKAKHTDADHTSFTITWPDGTTQVCGPYHTAEPLVLFGGEDGGLGKLYDDLCDNGGTGGPDFGLTTEALFRKLVAQAKAEQMDVKNPKLAELGFPENLMFRGATIAWDRNATSVNYGNSAGTADATTGNFIFLNSEFIELKPYAGYDKTFRASAVQDLMATGILGKAVIMQWRGNFVTNKPGKHGALTNKT